MPAAKKAVKKSARKSARPRKRTPAKAGGSRKLSTAHKRALAEGRTMSATVDRYISAVNTPKRRGRKVSKAALQSRLAEARGRAKSATGVCKVLAAQEVRELQSRIAALDISSGGDIKCVEAAYVKIA